MASMKFVVKYFSEITIKSKPVRKRFVARLADNLRDVLRDFDPDIRVQKEWDKIQVLTAVTDAAVLAQLVEAMRNTSGITYILEVNEHPLGELAELVEPVMAVYGDRLAGKTFALRCKRSGKHSFTSMDVERQVGGAVMARSGAAAVKLKNPEVTVELEISHDRVFIVSQRHRGLGGYPVGSIDPVLSLISGGFDSPVASYLTMKRGKIGRAHV